MKATHGSEYRFALALAMWIILYLFLATQLLYNVIIVRRVYDACEAQRSEVSA